MRKRFFIIIRIALGSAFFIGLIIWVGSEGIIDRLSNLYWPWLMLLPFLWLINLITIGIGQFVLLGTGTNISVINFFRCVFISSSLGAFLPFQIGESSLVLFLKNQGVPFAKSVGLFITDKIVSLFAIWILGSIGIFLIVYKHDIVLWIGLGLPTLFIILALITINSIDTENENFKVYLKIKVVRFIYDKMKMLFGEMLSNRDGIAINLITTVVRMLLIQPIMFFICFKACGVQISIFYLMLISNILVVVSLIPITAQGLGVVEVSAVYLFSLINVNESATVAVYIISRPLNFVFSGLVLLITGNLFDKFHRRDRFEDKS